MKSGIIEIKFFSLIFQKKMNIFICLLAIDCYSSKESLFKSFRNFLY